MAYSSDGVTWATAPVGAAALNAITWSPDKNQFVAVGVGTVHSVVINPDLSFTSSSSTLGLTGVAWSNNDNAYVATAGGTGLGKTYKSSDGLNWGSVNNTPPVNGPWNDIAYAEDKDLFCHSWNQRHNDEW